jgi:hypothetical protein
MAAALRLVHLYAERGSPKFEPAARRWLVRHLVEGAPRLQHIAEVAASLAQREISDLSDNRTATTRPRAKGSGGGGLAANECLRQARLLPPR